MSAEIIDLFTRRRLDIKYVPGFTEMVDAVGIADELAPPTSVAGFYSSCPSCGEKIEINDVIAMRDGEWICGPCALLHDFVLSCTTFDIAKAKADHPSGGTTHATT